MIVTDGIGNRGGEYKSRVEFIFIDVRGAFIFSMQQRREMHT